MVEEGKGHIEDGTPLLCAAPPPPLSLCLSQSLAPSRMFGYAPFSICPARVNLWMCSSALLLSSACSPLNTPSSLFSSLHPLGL